MPATDPAAWPAEAERVSVEGCADSFQQRDRRDDAVGFQA